MTNRQGRRQRNKIWGEPPRPTAPKSHGLTQDQVDHMIEVQNYKCVICMDPLKPDTRVIDHDHALAREHGHKSNRGCPRCVRAVLCIHCNMLLGAARDDINILARAIAFLKTTRNARR